MTAPQFPSVKPGPRIRLWLCALATGFGLVVAAGPAQADWIRDFKAEAVYNDNVSRSSRESDVHDDFAYGASAHLGKFVHLASSLKFTLTLDVDSQVWAQYHDFNNVTAGGTASLRQRFGLGANAPFIRVEGSAKVADFDQALQDGARYRVSVVAGQRFGERFELNLAYLFDRADASDSVFEQEGHAFLARIAVDLSSGTQLTAEYSVRRGEVVSYAVPPRPDLVALANKRIVVDTFGEPYTAYNIDATTHRLGFGVGQALTAQLGLSLRYEWQITSRAEIEYTNHVVTAAFQLSF